MRATGRSLAFAAVTLFLGAGCISVQPQDGAYTCAVDSDCPTNYVCDPAVLTCWKRGHLLPSDVDMSMPDDLAGADSPQCHDEMQNGSETDIDCGGDGCAACATGKHCVASSDCISMLCNDGTGQCVGTKCEDNGKDGNETDVDCGGGACTACADGKGCKINSDCTSNICNLTTKTCVGTLCSDGEKDGQETDKDCGGNCPKCLGGKACDGNADCLSGQCSIATHTCAASACENGAKDGSETDTDCGGTMCPKCDETKTCAMGSDCKSGFCNATAHKCVADQCHDGTMNGAESDIDCGGATCGSNCKVNDKCKVDGDCASGSCSTSKVCVSTQCMDGSQDGMETDKDCGGGTCPGCDQGAKCTQGTRDCKSMYCNASSHMCVADQCHDGTTNGSESDTDCGGSGSPVCPRCANDNGCNSGTDCTSTFCNKDSKKCVGSHCNDGFKDNGESDIDCGAPSTTCSLCATGKSCGTSDANCASGVCNFVSQLCVTDRCGDGRKDGNESDTDCGGGTCNACVVNKICNGNSDCVTSACDVGPSPHVCISDQCKDNNKDGNETDKDCGGGACNKCGVGLLCTTGSDCTTGFCNPSSHRCACGGADQACCNGGSCNPGGDSCSGKLTCSGANICVKSTVVVCPAPSICHSIGICDPSNGICSTETPQTGGTCNLNPTDQCYVANTSTCNNGSCQGGTHVDPRCNAGGNVETCNNNSWTQTKTCNNGCSGAGVCNGPAVPAVSVIVDGSDFSVNWGTPATGVNCTLQRNDNNGNGWQVPAATVSPCPGAAPGPCKAYDRALLRANYNYRLVCSDASGSSTGPAFPASGSLQPGLEICAGDWADKVEVHTAFPDNIHDKLERQISTAASLAATTGVAFLAPAAGNTNCAPNDHSCGTIFVASHDNNKVMAFDRRANDADASSGGPQAPSNSQRTLTISLKDSGVTVYKPFGVAVAGNTLIVANNNAPGFLAGYSVNFSNSTSSPNWYLRGTSAAHNKIASPLAVAVDSGSGTGSGWVFVANGVSGNTVINGFKLDEITNAANINPSNFVNDVVAPFVTIATPNFADAIAIDSTTHTLYATQAAGGGKVSSYSTQTGALITSFNGRQLQLPTGIAFVRPATGPALVFVVDNATGNIQSYPAGSSGVVDAITNLTVSSLMSSATGLVICN